MGFDGSQESIYEFIIIFMFFLYRALEQLVARQAHNLEVPDSSSGVRN